MEDKKRLVLIFERSDDALAVEEDNNYVFEGVFGELGVKNRNKRFYTAEQYLPQVKDLQKSIEEGGLLGELDHPDRFNVKLSEASHRIEELKLEKTEDGRNLIKGKIRLLNTSRGKDAKALSDGGVPLKISSRAAGVVENNGEVKLKKIFTYDLVHNPGFENAKLNRINESLGIEDDNIDVYEVTDELLKEDEELAKIYDNEFNINNKTNEKKNNSNKMSNYVTQEELDNYSAHVKKKYDSINENIGELTEKLNSVLESDSVSPSNDKTKKLVEHNNYIVEKLNSMKGYIDNEVVRKLNEKFGDIEETVNNLKRYSQYVADAVTENANESEEKFEQIDNLVKYTEYIAENADNLIEFSNYLSENLDDSIKHNDYIVENLEASIKHGNYNTENLEDVIKYNNYIAENINENNTSFNFGSDDLDSNLRKISESVDSLITKSTKQEEEEVNNLPGFLKLVNEDKVEDFKQYPQKVQEALVESFENKDVQRKSAVNRIWEETVSDFYDFEEMIPESLETKWENCTEQRKEEIREEADSYDLTTESKIENFWATREFDTAAVHHSRRLRRSKFIHGTNKNDDEQLNEDYKGLVNKVKSYNKSN